MTKSLFDLSGWIALILGSTQGLGESMARVLVEHGARVIISSQKEKACGKIVHAFWNDGLSAEGLPSNIGHRDAINDAYHHVAKTHG